LNLWRELAVVSARTRRLVVLWLVAVCGLGAAVMTPAALAAGPAYLEAPNTQPTVDTIQDGAVNAPYNLSQGITSFDTLAITPYPAADLLGTFTFTTGASTTQASNGAGVEPNLAVYPAQTGSEPFPSGFAASPGPLSGYCGATASDTWNAATPVGTNPNETATPVSQPLDTTLPFAPYYFPYVVRNADGSLTGYFDWRPKDADEAIVSATSTDNGKTWTATGEALNQNGTYCPSADTNDDGLGHPYVAALDSGGTDNQLYTLQRADGDYTGTSLDTYPVTPSAADPLTGVPASTSVGVDPNTFATGSTAVAATGGTAVAIPVSTLGGDAANGNSITTTDSDGGTLTQPDVTALPSGPAEYEDMTQAGANGGIAPLISCTASAGSDGATGSAAPMLTGCTTTTAAGITVAPNDDLVEVIGTASKMVTDAGGATATSIPYGPQNAAGTLGTDITLNAISSNSDTLTYLLNANAPNRYYINGDTVYCTQGNADPTTKIELCTTTNPSGDPVTTGPLSSTTATPITADPALPSAGPNYTGGPVSQTNGLISPDGIIGLLPASANAAWGEPNTGKVVLYTEKKANYFIEGGTNGTISGPGASMYANYKTASGSPLTLSTLQTGSSSTLETGFVNTPGTTPTDYNISPFPSQAEKLPTSGSFNVYVGAETNTAGAEMVTMTCTGWDVNPNLNDLYNPSLHTIDLTGCTSANSTDILNAGHQGNWVAGPGAAIETTNASGTAILPQIGEGKSIIPSNAQKLFGNNEDYEVIRAAYTTDGINFTDLGAISGSTSGTPALGSTTAAGGDTGAYDDISNPFQQAAPAGNNAPSGTAVGSLDPASPQGDSPANLPVGSPDTVELRWPGARGTIITNSDGSIGLFLSGAWASDGDSDAFNQIFYTQSSNGGKSWSTPTVVQSTDYTFAASAAQDTAAAGGTDSPLGISAYYSGRAYDPTVVANPDGTLTMVFAGYRLPNPVKAAGNPLGTNPSAQYCSGVLTSGTCSATGSPVVGETDPALYRNILTETLWPNVGPLQAPTATTGVTSTVANTSATVAGAVQTDEPDTTVAIVFGTSPTSLTRSVSAGTVDASTDTHSVSATLGGLSAGTTYYYATQATDASRTSTGQVASFTTTGGTTPTTTTTVTTPGPTVTTPGSTVTTPGKTVTTPGATTDVGPSATTLDTLAQYSIASSTVGNQKISVEVPNPAICLASPAVLKVSYQSTAVNGSKARKLSFVHATLSVDGKVRATVKTTTAADKLGISGLKPGAHTLKVTSTYHYRVGKHTKTDTKTQTLTFKVC
jgi:hypothetical protein